MRTQSCSTSSSDCVFPGVARYPTRMTSTTAYISTTNATDALTCAVTEAPEAAMIATMNSTPSTGTEMTPITQATHDAPLSHALCIRPSSRRSTDRSSGDTSCARVSSRGIAMVAPGAADSSEVRSSGGGAAARWRAAKRTVSTAAIDSPTTPRPI
ncbi:hypothetical protein MOKP118_39090 [Mycobacterium avium subsp. hominissuis]